MPPPPVLPAGTLMIGGDGTSPSEAYAFLSPDGATSYPQPLSAPRPNAGIAALGRTAAGHVIELGGTGPTFPQRVGLYDAADLTVLSAYTGTRGGFYGVAADALGFWYMVRASSGGPEPVTLWFTRLNAASAEVATWDIPLPAGYSPGINALAVSGDGQIAYCWMFQAPPHSVEYRIHRFDLSGSGAWLGRFPPTDYDGAGAGFQSLCVVPGSGDLLAAYADYNEPTVGRRTGAIVRYRPDGTVVWVAGTPSGAGIMQWVAVAPGVPGDTHFVAWGVDPVLEDVTYSEARYCWFSYATGAPDTTRNFAPDDGAFFKFDSQMVVLAQGVPAPTDPAHTPIRRLRRAPHLTAEHVAQFFARFQLDLEAGVGNAADPGADPQVYLRWSDDGGHTWRAPLAVSAGTIGAFRRRAIWRRLGRSRDRVFEVSMSDPVKWALLAASLDAQKGTS